jgi:lipopolysaccharide/colanic/teichoic acid biosynthesis glycosyltransferase
MKRSFDVVVGLGILLIFAPVILVLSIVLHFTLGSPILFKQQRPGLRRELFTMYKFRTMTEKRNDQGDLFPDAERLTKLGRLMRASSLDELPALWNVLKGEMSLVGPRPLLVEYLPMYSDEQNRRHDVKPGMTGWAQVNGRNAISWDDKFRLDVWYVDNQSLWLDLKIIGMTVKSVLLREGISLPGEATTKKFSGNR